MEQGERLVNKVPVARAIARVLLPAEWVRARAVLHRSIYLPAVTVFFLWLAVFIWAVIIGVWLLALLAAIVVCLFAPVLLGWAWWRKRTSILLLTDQRLVAVRGPFPVKVQSLPLTALDQVHVRRPRVRMGRVRSLYAIPFRDAPEHPLVMHDLAGAEDFVAQVIAAAGSRSE